MHKNIFLDKPAFGKIGLEDALTHTYPTVLDVLDVHDDINMSKVPTSCNIKRLPDFVHKPFVYDHLVFT